MCTFSIQKYANGNYICRGWIACRIAVRLFIFSAKTKVESKRMGKIPSTIGGTFEKHAIRK
ncbi:hypothetical protein MASR2M47_06990 [Draconibacterium sp.]